MEAAIEAVARADIEHFCAQAEPDDYVVRWDDLTDAVRAESVKEYEIFITTFLAHLDATGWQIVPKNPEDGMIETGEEKLVEGRNWGKAVFASEIYGAMLAAAPKWGA